MRATISNVVVGFAAVGLALALTAGCSEVSVAPVSSDSCVEDPSAWVTLATVPNDAVDVLLVIDDSASMAEEQATLAASLASIAEVLERPELSFDYRIGITTTNVSNPLCQSTTTPENAALQVRSCRGHLDDFVGGGDGAPPTDVTEVCTDACPAEWAAIETLATATAEDAVPRPRPWIERNGRVTNLPAGLDPAQALQCLGLQGIGGCAYEAPLEAMHRVVQRSTMDADPAAGFLRDDAVLFVVLVTDEDDCSHHPEHESIFLPEGNRAFWPDPAASEPSSAVCWNAGVACSGEQDGRYEGCEPVDLDIDANPVAEDDAEDLAVLRPVSRYVDLLERLDDQKRAIYPPVDVLVSIVSGVNADGSVTYQDSTGDPAFQQEFGIGPGCESTFGRAAPPVRLRALAEALQQDTNRNAFTVCGDDYAEALEAIAARTLGQVQPACMPGCVADTDPSTPDVLDPSCTVVQMVPRDHSFYDSVTIPRCDADATLPDGHDVCYVPLMGDERSEYCIDSGSNLEFQLVRREGVEPPAGTLIQAQCALSACAATDCPDLP